MRLLRAIWAFVSYLGSGGLRTLAVSTIARNEVQWDAFVGLNSEF